jgi:hypothetical protein
VIAHSGGSVAIAVGVQLRSGVRQGSGDNASCTGNRGGCAMRWGSTQILYVVMLCMWDIRRNKVDSE